MMESNNLQCEKENFVTVVSVGSEENILSSSKNEYSTLDGVAEYITVLKISDTNEENSVLKNVIEEVLVYRLPGERLGFGLKFEGGTKSNEFVKRLFIQSCAPNSPASRVHSSWGNLAEGDEILEIDCIPVNNMTRIDCVRSLKDSNVVIKLLVKHFYDKISNTFSKSDQKTKSIEDLPQVISAEKKRSPPPPPPVPPRKIPRKFYKTNTSANNNNVSSKEISDSTQSKTTNVNTNKNKKFPSTRSSGRSIHSPEVPRRNRKYSDCSLGPPNAEVYTDLFSQDSRQSLSESDDTGSSISTVVDRFSSFPTTTTSSLAGSLPSTPTSIQKHLDLSNLLNSYDDEEISSALKHYTLNNNSNEKIDKIESIKSGSNATNDDGTPLQPPSSFQDAPLSYGDEDMRIIESNLNKINYIETGKNRNEITINGTDINSKKPPVPPRSRDLIIDSYNNSEENNLIKSIHDENMNSLPRLVDFVPKFTTNKGVSEKSDIIKLFLENERRECNDLNKENINITNHEILRNIYNEIDLYDSNLSTSSLLSTIGEDDEEGHQDSHISRLSISSAPPIVVVENVDETLQNCDSSHNNNKTIKNDVNLHEGIIGNMEALPSDSRQPPDGHEFPDYEETSSEISSKKLNYKKYETTYNFPEKSNLQLQQPLKTYKSTECINLNHNNSSFNLPSNFKPNHEINNASKINLKTDKYNSKDDITFGRTEVEVKLHTRSQSLIDMSGLSKQKNDRWQLLAEQRRKGLSKLKGLVIPEHISENDALPSVNLPEIVSNTAPSSIVLETKFESNLNNPQLNSKEIEQVALPLSSPPWTLNNNDIPKYSPAFKRKSLQIYPSSNIQKYNEKIENNLSNKENKSRMNTNSNSDFLINSLKATIPEFKLLNDKQISSKLDYDNKEFMANVGDLRKCEGESDDDSAVSSSQSSYFSKYSPPLSPNTSCDMLDYESNSDSNQSNDKYNNLHGRLLKPASVEAINRKNILASAKCRSGRDLKVGSPVIQRKCNEENSTNIPQSIDDISIIDLPSANESDFVPEMEYESLKNKNDDVIIKNNRISISKEKSEKDGLLIKLKTPSIEKITIPSTNSFKNSKVNERETKLSPKNFAQLESKVNSILQNTKSLSVSNLRKSFENLESTNIPPNYTTKKIKRKTIDKIEINQKFLNENLPIKMPSWKEDSKQISKTPTIKTKPNTIVENKTTCTNIESNNLNKKTITLCPKTLGESIGITLAGGTDYETKEITIHRIRYGSVAYENGNLKRGDKLISINGKSTKGITHAESVEMLKEAVTKFVLIVEENEECEPLSSQRKSLVQNHSEKPSTNLHIKNVTHKICLLKDGSAGLGFSIEGGKDSLQGDVPLLIKKIFKGGAADKNGELIVGDELIAINDKSLSNLSKIEAWTLMKKLPDGNVTIHIHR